MVDGSNGLFVSMPRKMGNDKKYHDIRYPVTEKMYENVKNAVMEKFQAGTPPTKASEREKPDDSLTLKVSATATLPEAGNHSKNLLAHVAVVIGDCFAINDVRVMKGKNGPFMALPSKKNAKTGEYNHTCFPATKQMWQDMNTAVMGAYQRAMERASVRGAVQAGQRDAAARPPKQAARTAQRATAAR